MPWAILGVMGFLGFFSLRMGLWRQEGGSDFRAVWISIASKIQAIENNEPAGLRRPVNPPEIDIVEGEAQGVTSVIKRYKGRIKLCYDQALRQDPSLTGRVEIEFSVGRGRVSEAFVSTNSTRNDELADCILRKVKAMPFDPSVEADVIYPFVLSQ